MRWQVGFYPFSCCMDEPPLFSPSSEPAQAGLLITAGSGDSSPCTKAQQWHSREGAGSNGVRAGVSDKRQNQQPGALNPTPQIPRAKFCFSAAEALSMCVCFTKRENPREEKE